MIKINFRKNLFLLLSMITVITISIILILSAILTPYTQIVTGGLYGITESESKDYTYYSMYNDGWFYGEYGLEHIFPVYSGEPYTYRKALIPWDNWYSYNYTHPYGNGLEDDDNSTFLYSRVETSNNQGYMLRQINVDSDKNFSLDFVIRYAGAYNLFDGEYSNAYLGLYTNETFELLSQDGYYIVNSSNPSELSHFTGVKVICHPEHGYPQMRLTPYTAETGLIGTTLIGTYSPIGSLENGLVRVSIDRYLNGTTWYQHFVIYDLENEEVKINDLRSISNTQDYQYFGWWSLPTQSEIGTGQSYHVIELKNITETGDNINGQPSDLELTGHVFRLGSDVSVPVILHNVSTSFTVDFEPQPVLLHSVNVQYQIERGAISYARILERVDISFNVSTEGQKIIEPPTHNILKINVDITKMIYSVFWLLMLFLPAIVLNAYIPGVGMIVGVSIMNTVLLFINPLYGWCAIVIYAYMVVLIIKGGI